MPNKLPIEQIKAALPPFVTILEPTYKGTRYKAQFLDVEYGETFWAIPSAVIKLQHGCKKRADARRSESCKDGGRGKRIPLASVIERLPAYLEIVPESYKGVREKARFRDKEFDSEFEALVCNVLRGKGYCQKREEIEFKKSITIPVKQIQERLDSLYGKGKVIIDPLSYSKMNCSCKFQVDGQTIKGSPTHILSGRYFVRKQLDRWKQIVNVRDCFACWKCKSSNEICAHHILPWFRSIEHRLNVNNGATLCRKCHEQYHADFKFEETLENFAAFTGIDLGWLKAKLAEPLQIPPV